MDRLVSQLHGEITQGRYEAGERLPTEFKIAEVYGVSRPIVREALGRLKHDGLVVSRQGSGLFVNNPVPASTFRLEAFDFTNRDEIRNIIELLIAVEASASELAARRRSAAQMQAIENRVASMEQAIARGEPGVEEDVAFHRTIVEAAGNAYFRDLSNFLDAKVRHFIRVARSNTSRSSNLTEAVQQEHILIRDAIRQQDGQAARTAAEAHLRNAALRLAIYLEGR